MKGLGSNRVDRVLTLPMQPPTAANWIRPMTRFATAWDIASIERCMDDFAAVMPAFHERYSADTLAFALGAQFSSALQILFRARLLTTQQVQDIYLQLLRETLRRDPSGGDCPPHAPGHC
jgi:hypothetical protein